MAEIDARATPKWPPFPLQPPSATHPASQPLPMSPISVRGHRLFAAHAQDIGEADILAAGGSWIDGA